MPGFQESVPFRIPASRSRYDRLGHGTTRVSPVNQIGVPLRAPKWPLSDFSSGSLLQSIKGIPRTIRRSRWLRDWLLRLTWTPSTLCCRLLHVESANAGREWDTMAPSIRGGNEAATRLPDESLMKSCPGDFSAWELPRRGPRIFPRTNFVRVEAEGTMVGDREKKNRFLTWSRPPPRRGLAELEPDDVYSRPGNLYFLPRTGGWSGKNSIFSLLDPSPSVVCHRLNNSLCLPVFPSFLGSQWAGITFCGNILRVLGGSTTK